MATLHPPRRHRWHQHPRQLRIPGPWGRPAISLVAPRRTRRRTPIIRSDRMPAPFRALGWRNYALYWTGALLSNIGSWMQTVALGWLVLQLTDSAFLVGFVSFAGLSPALLLSLFGGVVADRMDRQRILIVTQTAMLVSTGILATLTAWGVVTVPQIIALSFVTGLSGAMSVPAQQALISELVPADVLPSAISLNA